jgi:predicted dinucleotide-binding enzyme
MSRGIAPRSRRDRPKRTDAPQRISDFSHRGCSLPETRVVKTLNTMLFTAMAAPEQSDGHANLFISGDDADAKSIDAGLLADLGWVADAMVDLGGIPTAQATEATILLTTAVLQARRFAPFALSLSR